MSVRCLIVDDNESFRHEMNGLLQEQGIAVVGGAASSAEAFAQIAELHPEVVLVDIDLGAESGLELVRGLHDGTNATHPPYLILISTHDESEYADLIEASPAIGFLAKTDLGAPAIRRMLGSLDASGLPEARRSDGRRGT